jgi:hypothetical protein
MCPLQMMGKPAESSTQTPESEHMCTWTAFQGHWEGRTGPHPQDQDKQSTVCLTPDTWEQRHPRNIPLLSQEIVRGWQVAGWLPSSISQGHYTAQTDS